MFNKYLEYRQLIVYYYNSYKNKGNEVMKMFLRRSAAALLAASIICGGAVSCSSKEKKAPAKVNNDSLQETESTTAPVEGVDFNEGVDAASGDAYLAVVDANWDMPSSWSGRVMLPEPMLTSRRV